MTRRRAAWLAVVAGIGAALVAFALFAVGLWRDVDEARSQLEHDVRWLVSVQALDDAAANDLALPRLLEAEQALASRAAGSSAELGEGQRALEAAVLGGDRQAVHDAAGALTRALRRQTGTISSTLGEAWSRLGRLVGGSLALALLTLGLLVAYTKMSDRLARSTEAQRQAALAESRRLAESLHALASQVTHDIANPLAFVASNHRFLELKLARAGAADPELVETLRDTREGLQRLEGLVAGFQAATALGRSGQDARVRDATNAALLLVEPRVQRTATLVRAYGDFDGLVKPVPFMRLLSSVLLEAVELYEPGAKAVVTLSIEGAVLQVRLDGEVKRPWPASLEAIARELAIPLELNDSPATARISLR